ncbi:MAG: hypothetical protein AAFN07_00825 [Pseudomonadota bacterium]
MKCPKRASEGVLGLIAKPHGDVGDAVVAAQNLNGSQGESALSDVLRASQSEVRMEHSMEVELRAARDVRDIRKTQSAFDVRLYVFDRRIHSTRPMCFRDIHNVRAW